MTTQDKVQDIWNVPLICSAGGFAYNSKHIDYWKARAEKAEAALASPPNAAPHVEKGEIERLLEGLPVTVLQKLFATGTDAELQAFDDGAHAVLDSIRASLRTQQAQASGEIETTTGAASGERVTDLDEAIVAAQIASKKLSDFADAAAPGSPVEIPERSLSPSLATAERLLLSDFQFLDRLERDNTHDGVRDVIEGELGFSQAFQSALATGIAYCKPQNLANGQPRATSDSEPQWRPIETAPLKQTILVCNPAEGNIPVVAKRYAGGWTNVGMVPVGLEKVQPSNYKIYDLTPLPTHWMPLPAAPGTKSVAHDNHAEQVAEPKPIMEGE